MYLRTTTRTNKDGSKVEYLSIAHNYRVPGSSSIQAKVLQNLGRKEQVDVAALRRLVDSINRFLGAEDQLKTAAFGHLGGEFTFLESRPMGGAWLLAGLWQQLGIGEELARLARAERASRPDELAAHVFAMVANRALQPLSKHATPEWLAHDVFVPGVPDGVYDEQLYRAMDFVARACEEIQKRVFFATADLLNLEVDLLLYDTTSAYFEMDEDDTDIMDCAEEWQSYDDGGSKPTRPRPQVVNDPPLRLRGHSRDERPDLPQVVIGLAVTREGIPVRCWVWPGNTNDATTVREVKESLAGWRLNRVVWAVDRGMVSECNLRELQRGGAHYIAGKKLRAGEADVEEALSRPGRYHEVRENLLVKQVVVGEGEARRRYVVIMNPAQAERDREQRERKVRSIETEIERLNGRRAKDAEGRQAHTKAVCALKAHPTKGRFVKESGAGRLHLDREAIKAEERLDGRYLVITSDDSLPPEDVALGYKQLAEVEAAWRSLKTDLDLRPMHHRKDDRIRAHVVLCWLALLLVRVTEATSGTPWWKVRQEMDRLHRGVFAGPSGRFAQLTLLTASQRHYLKVLKVAEPKPFERFEVTQSRLDLAPS